VVDAELFRPRSLARWLDAADARIKRTTTGVDPPPLQRGLPRLRPQSKSTQMSVPEPRRVPKIHGAGPPRRTQLAAVGLPGDAGAMGKQQSVGS
jgi:hypothetical protein